MRRVQNRSLLEATRYALGSSSFLLRHCQTTATPTPTATSSKPTETDLSNVTTKKRKLADVPQQPPVASTAVGGEATPSSAPRAEGQETKIESKQPADNLPSVPLPAAVAGMKDLTIDIITAMTPFEVYRQVRSVLMHRRAMEKLIAKPGGRQHRLFTAALRRATIRALPSSLVARTLWKRMSSVIEERSISLTQAAAVVSIQWPRMVSREHQRSSLLLTSWIIDTLRYTLPQAPPAAAPNTDSKDAGAAAAPPTTTPVPTKKAEDGSPLFLSPPQARSLLRNLPEVLKKHPSLVGPLVTIGFEDLETVTDPNRILRCLWAIENAKTHAPDAVWRRAVNHLWDLHRRKAIPVHGDELRKYNWFYLDLLETATSASTSAPAAAPLKPKKVGKKKSVAVAEDFVEATKEAAATMTENEETARVFNAPVVGHRGLSVPEVHRLLRVLKRERWSGDVSVLRGIAFDALRTVARNDGAMRSVDDRVPRSPVVLYTRLQRVSGLKPNDFVSLCVIAGELGISFSTFLEPMDKTVLIPIIQFHDSFGDITLISEMLFKTKCHSAEVYQALIDRIRKQGVNNAMSLDLTLQVGRRILYNRELMQNLQFGPFMELLEMVAAQSVKMNGRMLASYADLIFQLSRRLSREGPHAQKLLFCVDEFSFQMHRLFANGVVAAEKVNVLLEFTLMLGMRRAPELYPHTQKLLLRRNMLHKECKEARLPFAGIVNGSWATSQAYHKIYFLTKYLAWMRVRVPRKQIDELYKLGTDHGLMHLFMGAKLFREVHYRSHVPTHMQPHPPAAAAKDGAATQDGAATTTTSPRPVVERRKLVKIARALERPVPEIVDRVILQSMLKCFESTNAPVRDATFTPVYSQALQSLLGVEVVNHNAYNLFVSAVDRAQLPLTKRHPRLWMYIRHLGASLKVDEDTQNRVDRIAAKYII